MDMESKKTKNENSCKLFVDQLKNNLEITTKDFIESLPFANGMSTVNKNMIVKHEVRKNILFSIENLEFQKSIIKDKIVMIESGNHEETVYDKSATVYLAVYKSLWTLLNDHVEQLKIKLHE